MSMSNINRKNLLKTVKTCEFRFRIGFRITVFDLKKDFKTNLNLNFALRSNQATELVPMNSEKFRNFYFTLES